MNDDDIINKADKLQRDELAAKQARSRGWMWTIFGSVMSVSLASAVVLLVPHCAEQKAQRENDDAHRHAEQEQAWSDCVRMLGYARCDAIEARLSERCLAARVARDCLEAEVQP